MGRLLLVVIMTVAGAVLLLVQQQPSVDTRASTPSCHDTLFATSKGVSNCSMQRDALLARATRGTLGGQYTAHRRVRTNTSPRP